MNGTAQKPFMQEWNKFSDEAIEEMKTYSDQTHLHREWMCYVYESNGVYLLGEPSYGDESRIEIDPNKKTKEDGNKKGVSADQRKWTIHGHPLKDGKIYTGRQYFSSTDILNEFIRSRDNDEYVVQYVVYPHQQGDDIHNRCRVLIFPNRDTLISAMKDSHPNMTDEDIMNISEANGYNSNATDGSLKNEAGIDWFAFQESLGKMGYMGIIDIEGPTGGKQVEAADTMFEQGAEGKNSKSFVYLGLIGLGLIALVKSGLLSSDKLTIDGFGADFETPHHWNR
jgi:hypothetical protein|tara:strand:+ start:874 stop:1719 length:846 start_codon:yes stop_codon:yes gene_type:complete